ncbi:hypothetical protein ACIP88_02840 [Streptomyces uncialis]|uniref:hypothetical protein n=1 Tax=Streptomyces uncialis TaxID=1048205 RepID=UPI003821AB11
MVGRPLAFEEIPLDTLRAEMRAEGRRDPDVDGMFAAYATMAEQDQPVWDTVEQVTGRPAPHLPPVGPRPRPGLPLSRFRHGTPEPAYRDHSTSADGPTPPADRRIPFAKVSLA